jgi:hypothetical protein
VRTVRAWRELPHGNTEYIERGATPGVLPQQSPGRGSPLLKRAVPRSQTCRSAFPGLSVRASTGRKVVAHARKAPFMRCRGRAAAVAPPPVSRAGMVIAVPLEMGCDFAGGRAKGSPRVRPRGPCRNPVGLSGCSLSMATEGRTPSTCRRTPARPGDPRGVRHLRLLGVMSRRGTIRAQAE